jgi:glucose-1-phosphate thymidylyltransferase
MELKGLVLAAGEGSRLRPFTFSRPKHLISLLGKPMIQYAIDDLVGTGIRDIGIVVGYFGDSIREALGDGSNYGAKLTYLTQEKRLGIAHAIHLALEHGFLDKQFAVYLGDNILSRGIEEHVRAFLEKGSDAHVLLSRVKDPSRFGVALIEDGKIKRLIEKPKEPISDLAVIGIYFFRDPDLVEKAFKSLKPSWRGEYEITELIQWFIDNGHRVSYGVTEGWWKDVGTYEGLLEALYLLLDRAEGGIKGEVRGEVLGRAVVEEGALVEGRVYGPAYIGKNAYVGKNAIVEHYASVERGARIVSGPISRSLVLEEALLDLGSLRLRDSVVGAKSTVRSRFENHGEARLVISDYSIVEI